MKKLYQVEVTTVMFVVADDRRHAEHVARINRSRDDSEPDFNATEIKIEEDVDDLDDLETLPWGGDGRTVGEYLAAAEESK